MICHFGSQQSRHPGQITIHLSPGAAPWTAPSTDLVFGEDRNDAAANATTTYSLDATNDRATAYMSSNDEDWWEVSLTARIEY